MAGEWKEGEGEEGGREGKGKGKWKGKGHSNPPPKILATGLFAGPVFGFTEQLTNR